MKRGILVAEASVGLLVVIGVLWIAGVGCYAEVNTGTGQIRLCFLGVPYDLMAQPEATKATLREIAQLPPALPATWEYVGTCRERDYFAWWRWFDEIAAWREVDTRIARLLMEEIVAVARGEKRTYLGEFMSMTAYRRNSDGTCSVKPDWRDDKYVIWTLRDIGYEWE